MTERPEPAARPTRVLDPISRTSEVLFGLIMVLTFTASLNASEAGREDVRLMLIAAVGCCLAWGIIDGTLYLLSVRAEKAMTAEALATAKGESPEAARQAIAEAVPPLIAQVMDDEDLERLRVRLLTAEPQPGALKVNRADWAAAFAVFLLVFLATVPIALPFLFIADPATALRVSHAVAIASLFAAGYALGKHWHRPLSSGLSMVVVGLAMVAVAIALGG